VPYGGAGQAEVKREAPGDKAAAAGPKPASSFNFPPGLIPQLVKDKQKWSEPYAPIPPDEIERMGLPQMPERDSYLSHRLAKFNVEITNHKPSQSRWVQSRRGLGGSAWGQVVRAAGSWRCQEGRRRLSRQPLASHASLARASSSAAAPATPPPRRGALCCPQD
jgi:hypothetical protein